MARYTRAPESVQVAAALKHATAIISESQPDTPAPGIPQARMTYIPKGSFSILDTWYVGGLRGTGSHHLSLAGVAVPAEHLAAPFFASATHDGPLWRIPLVTLAAMFLAAAPRDLPPPPARHTPPHLRRTPSSDGDRR